MVLVLSEMSPLLEYIYVTINFFVLINRIVDLCCSCTVGSYSFPSATKKTNRKNA